MTHYLSESEILELRADLDDVLRVKKLLQVESQTSSYNDRFFSELKALRTELDLLEMVA